MRVLKVLCVFCGRWFDWRDPGDSATQDCVGAGCCGDVGCLIEGMAECVKVEKWRIAMEAQGREVAT